MRIATGRLDASGVRREYAGETAPCNLPERAADDGECFSLDHEPTLLGADEPPPYNVLDVEPAHPALLVCDHASNRVPARLGGLGITPADLETHLGLDIGAADVTHRLSERLGLPAVLCGYSRLVVDCNRRLDDPSAYPTCNDNVVVPGNQGLTHENRQQRADALYWPYHHAVRAALVGLEAQVRAPALIAIHSFTPTMGNVDRPWHVGVLWDSDPRIPVALLDFLRALPDLVVGDNEPYSGKHPHDFTIDYHAEAGGLPHVSIEIRQDLISNADGIARWSNILAEALGPILSDPDLYTHWTV
jgi:predicted N-formylglutamate amidohydrolase